MTPRRQPAFDEVVAFVYELQPGDKIRDPYASNPPTCRILNIDRSEPERTLVGYCAEYSIGYTNSVRYYLPTAVVYRLNRSHETTPMEHLHRRMTEEIL